MGLSKTAAAAQKAVEKGQTKAKVARTPEKIMKDIRTNLEAKLAVTPQDTAFLLKEYDRLAEVAEEFRSAYQVGQDSLKERQERLDAISQELRDKNHKLIEVETELFALRQRIQAESESKVPHAPIGCGPDGIGTPDN